MKLLHLLLLLVLICVPAVAQKSLPAIKSQADFDKVSVTYDPNTPYALPHVMLVIDRKDNNKIYYVNKKRYSFHKDFVNGTYLSLERGREFFINNYLKPNRRFILGTLAYQTPIRRWTFEFWEGDLVTTDLIQLAYEVINKTFFMPVAFKPNTLPTILSCRHACPSASLPSANRQASFALVPVPQGERS